MHCENQKLAYRWEIEIGILNITAPLILPKGETLIQARAVKAPCGGLGALFYSVQNKLLKKSGSQRSENPKNKKRVALGW